MAVKHRSNWYIYIITFIITAVLLGLVVWQLRPYLFPEKRVTASDSSESASGVPSETHNVNVLLMLGQAKGGTPEYFSIMSLRPHDRACVLVPLKAAFGGLYDGADSTLTDAYKRGGVEAIITIIKNELGIDCGKYIKFDKEALIDFLDLAGSTTVNIPYNISDGKVAFEAGANVLRGAELYEYLTFADLSEGEDYRLVVHGSAFTNFLNANFEDMPAIDMQALATVIVNEADTDISLEYYTANVSAYRYLVTGGSDLAEYYVPYGEYEGEIFKIAENSINTIKDRFGMAV